MGFEKKAPPIKIELKISSFNALIDVLTKQINEENEHSTVAVKIKDKIMKYGIPRKNKQDVEIVDIRFFPSEIPNFIECLTLKYETLNSYDYYSELDRNKINE